MNEIKFLRQSSPNNDELQQKLQFEETLISPKNKKTKTNKLASIQPWMEGTDANPFMLSNMKQTKISKSSRYRRQSSLVLCNHQKIIQKNLIIRKSIGLPVMDIGQPHLNRKIANTIKLKSKLVKLALEDNYRSKSQSDFMLPSVKLQLNIERKLYLIKDLKNLSNNSSPIKVTRLRSIIKDARF